MTWVIRRGAHCWSRQWDARPVRGETLQQYINRTICGAPSGDFWREWGWDRSPYASPFIEASYVYAPYVPIEACRKLLR